VPGTRPTAERTREALFSIWQARVEGARFLDLFCGSGAAGLEALSRGAAAATLVDADRRAVAVAERNRDRLGAAAGRTLRLALPGALGSGPLRGESFDLVFADPPYDFEDWVALLAAVEPLLATGAEIVIEHAARVELPDRVASLRRFDARRYGDSALAFYRRQGTDCSRNEASSR
jgi:16S rRNA (guanine966-N2)-methyltransferase